ncbi:hypothetical protein RLO149_c001530 [Roseobacter litoralis Och 149]|uniref:Uncharacterized protein n=1 Tax=Roseobacter litoralis (strain ATCC 49566 / DSM 6996 / JCM 21268 / NBRC 15278 / OCh 149) TaxID=391595 RepID=F7ZEV4_ROSLO|nr:hypothetical protein RLO149_c001530 [Roseobacter litoralis Och 149]
MCLFALRGGVRALVLYRRPDDHCLSRSLSIFEAREPKFDWTRHTRALKGGAWCVLQGRVATGLPHTIRPDNRSLK